MKNVRKMLLAALVTVAFGIMAGCGSDSSSSATVTKATTATVVAAPPGSPAGSVATAAAVTATTSTGVAVTTIPANTVITPEGGSLAAGPITLNIQTPANGTTSGMKVPTGTVVVGAAGAVDISIAGVNGFTVPAPGLTVNIPVTDCAAGAEQVTVVRYDGSSYTATGTCSNNIVTVAGITKFSSMYSRMIKLSQ